MLKKLAEHFGVISALVSVIASFLTMVFLYSYLGPFDQGLIWLIEYPDVIKFCLIGIAILSGILTFFLYFIQDFNSYLKSTASSQLYFLIFIFVLLTMLLATELYADRYLSSIPTTEYHIFKYVTLIALVAVIASVMKTAAKFSTQIDTISFIQVTYILSAMLFLIFLIGRTAGLYVRDAPSTTYTISFTPESGFAPAQGARIVMITSRYTVFSNRDGLTTVPSSIVIKIVSVPIIYI